MGISYGYIAYKTILVNLSIGDFSLYTTSIMNLSSEVSSIINQLVDLKRSSEYINPFIELLEVKSTKNKDGIILNEFNSLEFKNVSFKYPHTNSLILDNISFKVLDKEKISIVGLNGAGKTTLIKLITKLYEPTSGTILVNGVDINKYEYNNYIKKISAVFQDFQLFAYSLLENISSNENNYDKALRSALKVDFTKLKELNKGLHTIYSKVYNEDGIELSGGESQKIAIARALYKDSFITILDEPTAALDPIAEAQIYEQFNELVSDRTAIYISHRMSSSVFCDKVLIINEGKILDYAPHDILIKNKDSLYYKLFMTQAKNYQLK